jgi:hypothetical protein
MVLALAVAVAAGTLLLLRPSEEKRIRRRLTQITELGGKAGPETVLTAAGKARGITRLMTDSVTISGAPSGLSGTYDSDALAAAILQGRARFETLEPSLHDLEIVLEGEGRATAHFTARLQGTSLGGPFRDVREMRCALVKDQEEGWLFQRIEAVEVMRK